MADVDWSDFANGNPKPILGCLEQVIRLLALPIDFKSTPEISRIANGDTLLHLSKIRPEEIYIRWVNYHLEKKGVSRRISNLGEDIKDLEAVSILLKHLGCEIKAPPPGVSANVQAAHIIKSSVKMNVPEVIQGSDLVKGREKLVAIFFAYLFRFNHGLVKLSTKEIEAVSIVDEDIQATREERVFRLWITSLNIAGVQINDLYDDCKDGILLCKVIHHINDKVIEWKKVEKVPKNDFGRSGNNGVAVAGCKAMGLRMIGISGNDITKGNAKSILAMIW